MKYNNVIFDMSAMGVTRKSIQCLRDHLVRTYDKRVIILQIKTGDILCGFMILTDDGRCYFTGDGFRTDHGGEGGSGFAAAKKLIQLFGTDVLYETDKTELPIESLELANALLKIANDEIGDVEDDEVFSKYNAPRY